MMASIRRTMRQPNAYPTSAIPPAGVLSLARNLDGIVSLLARSVVIPPLLLLGLVLGTGRPGCRYLCSTWLADEQRSICLAHQLTCALSRPKSAGSPPRPMRRFIDRQLAKWFLLPTDLWRALPADRRFGLELPAIEVAAPVDAAFRGQRLAS
jgi:hypothetical protein